MPVASAPRIARAAARADAPRGRTAGLARDDYLAAGRPQPGGGPVRPGCSCQAFATLEGDESAVHSVPAGSLPEPAEVLGDRALVLGVRFRELVAPIAKPCRDEVQLAALVGSYRCAAAHPAPGRAIGVGAGRRARRYCRGRPARDPSDADCRRTRADTVDHGRIGLQPHPQAQPLANTPPMRERSSASAVSFRRSTRVSAPHRALRCGRSSARSSHAADSSAFIRAGTGAGSRGQMCPCRKDRCPERKVPPDAARVHPATASPRHPPGREESA